MKIIIYSLLFSFFITLSGCNTGGISGTGGGDLPSTGCPEDDPSCGSGENNDGSEDKAMEEEVSSASTEKEEYHTAMVLDKDKPTVVSNFVKKAAQYQRSAQQLPLTYLPKEFSTHIPKVLLKPNDSIDKNSIESAIHQHIQNMVGLNLRISTDLILVDHIFDQINHICSPKEVAVCDLSDHTLHARYTHAINDKIFSLHQNHYRQANPMWQKDSPSYQKLQSHLANSLGNTISLHNTLYKTATTDTYDYSLSTIIQDHQGTRKLSISWNDAGKVEIHWSEDDKKQTSTDLTFTPGSSSDTDEMSQIIKTSNTLFSVKLTELEKIPGGIKLEAMEESMGSTSWQGSAADDEAYFISNISMKLE